MSKKDNEIYEGIWEELSDPMREGLQDPTDIHQQTFAALWKRDLLGPASNFEYEVTSLGKAVLRWAKRKGHIS